MQRLEITICDTGAKKQLDIYEVYWGDIILKNYSDDLPVWKKVIFGLELIFFWFFSPIWKAAYKNKWMFTGIAFSGLIITFWYISIVGIFISALDSTHILDSLKTGFTETAPLTEEAMRMGLLVNQLPKLVSNLFTEIFLIAGVVIALFPSLLSLILRVAGFCMKFMKSKMARDDAKNRVQSQMNAVNKNDDYYRVTFFAYSLGMNPTIDFLSNYDSVQNKNIRLITVGSQVSFLANKAKVLRQHAKDVKNNQLITEWADYFSKGDWLCSYESLGEEGSRVFSKEINIDSSWTSKMSTATHLSYFHHSTVVEKLIST